MRICLVHNEYGRPSGEEAAVGRIRRLLENKGHEVLSFTRSSAGIEESAVAKFWAFWSGIYSLSAKRAFGEFVRRCRPDIVQVQNVYPLLSPSILVAAAQAGIPVVLRCPNYRLTCPSGLHMARGGSCEKCLGGKEYWCLLRNCEGYLRKSLGYAIRSWWARINRYILENVSQFIVLTQFQQGRFVSAGFPPNRISVIPNSVDTMVPGVERLGVGEYVAFVGRVSREKGIDTLCGAASHMSRVTFHIAARMSGGARVRLPPNMATRGFLSGERLAHFYSHMRILVCPSVCFEGFPNVIAEAMSYGKPVVCSRIGGLPEIVDDGMTGLLFEPGNAGDLAEKIRYLWDRPDVCRRMGQAGREKALREYSPEKYYERLMAVYEKAIALGPGGPHD